MQFTFLGTSGMVPTKKRNVSGYFLKYGSEGILFDCGEGTQRQMNLTGLKRTSITKICITHWHGDHISGLPGLLHTISNETEIHRVDLFGPPGTKKRMKALMEATDLHNNDWIHIHELKPKGVEVCFENEEFEIHCAPMEHSTPCIAYAFVEKDRVNLSKAKLRKYKIPEGPHLKKLKAGKDITYKGIKVKASDVCIDIAGRKLTFITDTRQNEMCFELAEFSDVLVCESTYEHKLLKKAKEHMHMTAQEAAEIASRSNCKKLYLTHFSQRYKSVQGLVDDARVVFDDVYAAEDLMKITL